MTIDIISARTDNILAFTAHDRVTGDDYESVLIPAVEAKLKEHRKIRLLYHLDDDFSGFEAQALWDDAKVGLQHLTAWEKIAVVSENKWMRGATKVFGFLMPCPVKVFDGDRLSEATAWLEA